MDEVTWEVVEGFINEKSTLLMAKRLGDDPKASTAKRYIETLKTRDNGAEYEAFLLLKFICTCDMILASIFKDVAHRYFISPGKNLLIDPLNKVATFPPPEDFNVTEDWYDVMFEQARKEYNNVLSIRARQSQNPN